MPVYISIVRGINLGGHNKLRMIELVDLMKNLGFRNVLHYIQSGNLLYTGEEKDCRALSSEISEALNNKYRLDVPVITLKAESFLKMVSENPFTSNPFYDIKFMHMTFLGSLPLTLKANSLSDKSFLPDEFRISGQFIYLYCPGGYGRTKLSNSFFERELELTATTRNWKTVLALRDLLGKTGWLK